MCSEKSSVCVANKMTGSGELKGRAKVFTYLYEWLSVGEYCERACTACALPVPGLTFLYTLLVRLSILEGVLDMLTTC